MAKPSPSSSRKSRRAPASPAPRLAHLRAEPVEGRLQAHGSLAGLLERAALTDGWMVFVRSASSERRVSYADLHRRALERLSGLREAGLSRGDAVLQIHADSEEFIVTFWACTLGGCVNVPLSYPTSLDVRSAGMQKLLHAWEQLDRPWVIGEDSLAQHLATLETAQPVRVLVGSACDRPGSPAEPSPGVDGDLALIQYSSGSTGSPKGVALTHRNILTNMEAIIMRVAPQPGETMMSWMPHSHDMGLALHLWPLGALISQVCMPPQLFVRRPLLLLEKMSQYRSAFSGSPNFGYRLLLDHVTPEFLQRIDLSALRLIFNGAEPISVAAMREFTTTLAAAGLPATAVYPVYGMAEATVAVSFPPRGSEPVVRSVARSALSAGGRIECVDADHPDAMLVVDEGTPVPGCELRIVDAQGAVVEENVVGHVQIRGENVTAGYYRLPEVNAAMIDGDWVRTGDLGFVSDGRLSITGRAKDVLIVNGQKFFAYDVEQCAGQVEGVVPAKIAACSWPDAHLGRERVALFVTLKEKLASRDRKIEVLHRVRTAVSQTFGFMPDELVTIQNVPRTTSGKLQRYQLRDALLAGELDDQRYPVDVLLGAPRAATAVQPDPVPAPRSWDEREVRELVRSIWSQVLGIEAQALHEDQPFLDAGGTSVRAMQVLGRVEQGLDLTLTHEFLLECKTQNEMAAYLMRHLSACGRLGQGQALLAAAAPELPGAPAADGGEPALQTAADEDEEAIAIIGMACRFPDADDPQAFWDGLLAGHDAVREVPPDRWDAALYEARGLSRSRWGAFLQQPYAFDAAFFGISEEEARIMDPQQRLFMQVSHEALESAGYAGERGRPLRVGVYAGASHNTYMEHHQHGMDLARVQQFGAYQALESAQQEALQQDWHTHFGEGGSHPHTVVNNLLNMIAARTAQALNLRGPALTIDTACSSALVAVHLAAQSLRRGECDVAVAGGVNLNLSPTPYLLFSRAGALSAQGRCRVFDAGADGFVPGEGAGVVALKTLQRALQDGDPVLAVLRRSVINNDGRSLGPMAPNPDGQRQAMQAAYGDGRLRPQEVQYVEAHGTGTALGDPSELRAIARVYGEAGVAPGACVVGSVKANVGHLLAAAGVASLIKMVQALRHAQMPPSLHVRTLNEQLLDPRQPLRVITSAQPWPRPAQGPRRAAVNAFGFGGTNCHVVLEEAPPRQLEPALPSGPELLLVSAPDAAGLERQVQALQRFLPEASASVAAMARTRRLARAHHRVRRAVVGASVQAWLVALAAAPLGREGIATRPASVALMYTGQGAQYAGMARELFEQSAAFRSAMLDCDAAFAEPLGQSLVALLYGPQAADDAQLAQTALTQPVMFAVDYALGVLLQRRGVQPRCVLGHSVGEYAAACLAGAMTLADAARLVAARGRLMSALPPGGAMMAVFATAAELQAQLVAYEGRLWMAAYNGRHQVVSGHQDAMDALRTQLQGLGWVCRPLQVSHAFHSPLLAPMLAAFDAELAQVSFQPLRHAMVSNLGGRWLEAGSRLDATYWRAQITAPVDFATCIEQARLHGVNVYVECGPDKVLSGLTRGLLGDDAALILPMVDRKTASLGQTLTTLGRLYERGLDLDWRDEAGVASGTSTLSAPWAEMPVYAYAKTVHRIAYTPEGGGARQHVAGASPVVTAAEPSTVEVASSWASAPDAALAATRSQRGDWTHTVLAVLAECLPGVPVESDLQRSFSDLGMDSATAVAVAERLGGLLGQRLAPTLLFEHQSPAALIHQLEALGPPPARLAVDDRQRPDAVSQATPRTPPVEASAQPLWPAEAAGRAMPPAATPDIAIIGVGLRLPGCDNLDQYWQLLMQGRTAIREVQDAQWSRSDYWATEPRPHQTYAKWGAFLERPYDFDPMFFGISPREAEVMDPQQRLFLQVAWEALQQSGYGGDYRTREIGVYVGCEQNHYGEHFIINQRYQALCERLRGAPWYAGLEAQQRSELLGTLREVLQPAELISDAVAGNGLNEIPARLSHWLDLRGPNLMVNTACSSSLVALHLACEALRSGQASMAIAGGAYLTGNDSPFVFLSRVGALSPTGQCAPFDARANGMVLGEGVTAVVLKPLQQAQADGDVVLAVIKGSAVNNDGHSNGITAPNPRGQADALRKAYRAAGLSPEQISYVECHGTGTPLGDPVEIDGMTQAFRSYTQRRQFCAVGSLKSTFGHMLSGASLPSLIKVVLAMRHRVLPPTAAYEQPNPHIDFAHGPFYVLGQTPQAWTPAAGQPRRAGINAFGFGGTNCHVILEEAPAPLATSAGAERSELLLLHARTPVALQGVAAQLAERLRADEQLRPEPVAYTFNGSQRDMACRAALLVNGRQDLLQQLDAVAQQGLSAAGLTGRCQPKAGLSVHLLLDGQAALDEPALEALCAEVACLAPLWAEARGLLAAHPSAGARALVSQLILGRWLLAAQLRPQRLLAEGAGILAAACLRGLLSLDQALALQSRVESGLPIGPALAVQIAPASQARWQVPLDVADASIEGCDDGELARLLGVLQPERCLSVRDQLLGGKGKHVIVRLGADTGLLQRLALDAAVPVLAVGAQGSAVQRGLALFAGLHLQGVRFDPASLARGACQRVLLPTYPFEYQTYRYKTTALPDTEPLLPAPEVSASGPDQRTPASASASALASTPAAELPPLPALPALPALPVLPAALPASAEPTPAAATAQPASPGEPILRPWQPEALDASARRAHADALHRELAHLNP